jgi:hypothetical protein
MTPDIGFNDEDSVLMQERSVGEALNSIAILKTPSKLNLLINSEKKVNNKLIEPVIESYEYKLESYSSN